VVIAGAVILVSEFRELMTIFYYLRFKTPPNLRAKSPIYMPQSRVAQLTLRNRVHFSSLRMTRREVFESAFTRGKLVAKFLLDLASTVVFGSESHLTPGRIVTRTPIVMQRISTQVPVRRDSS
jgi:hypothetical protein